jgi:ADP-heptose:LPS heptosyltransferase
MAMTNFGQEFEDFSDTAAVIENLDLVISIDTSVAHLAGAMGKPVWALLPYACDWRWLLNREDSPWYPSMRLFRQTKNGDWNSVLQGVASALEELVEF